MNTGRENWYIYYPAPRDGGPAALQRLRAMQQRLSTGGVGRVSIEERVGETTTPTWMEVYEDIQDPGAFAAALASALRESQLPSELMTARRIERFRSL
jgi:predicted phage gp36 major capsid-like protein